MSSRKKEQLIEIENEDVREEIQERKETERGKRIQEEKPGRKQELLTD